MSANMHETPTRDPRFALPDLTAAELGALMKLTERQVKDRVASGKFVCHWNGDHRGMRFTPEDVEHNRGVGASSPSERTARTSADSKALKGVARLRKAGVS